MTSNWCLYVLDPRVATESSNIEVPKHSEHILTVLSCGSFLTERHFCNMRAIK